MRALRLPHAPENRPEISILRESFKAHRVVLVEEFSDALIEEFKQRISKHSKRAVFLELTAEKD